MRTNWIKQDGIYIYKDNGATAVVAPDDEPTGHWFIDVEHADGTMSDDFRDSQAMAMDVAEDLVWSK